MSEVSPSAGQRRGVIRVGRIRGTDVEIHPSLIVLLLVVTWAAASHLLPEQAGRSTYTTAQFWMLGVAGALLLMASVVLHELAHVAAARLRGRRVDRITLFFHGGQAAHGEAAATPGEELLVTAAGPAVTLVVTIVSAVGASLLANVRHVGPLLQFSATTNAVLLLAHLLPGLPLDGGRMVRALAWMATGDRHRGTAWAGRVGVASALVLALLCAGGIALQGVGSGWTLGLVLSFLLGLQCLGASRVARLRGRLEGLVVRDAMERPPSAIPRVTSVADALLDAPPAGAAWLVEFGGRLGGIVTVAQLLGVPEEERHQTPIGQVATRLERQHLLDPRLALEAALNRMLGERLPLLPVVADGTLVGILRRDTIFHLART